MSKVINKIDRLLNEKEDIPEGLLNWVISYIEMRHAGNVKGAKEVKKSIDKEIKKLKLNKNSVYLYFGDPDKDKESVSNKIDKFKLTR